MLRVSDPYYDLSQQLFQTDPKCKPLTFKDPRSIGGFNVLKEYLRATKDGFKFETLAQHEVLGIGNKTNTLIPKMALIRNGRVEHVFDQELQERAPDVVGTVVLSLPWLTANTEENEKLEEWSQISSCSNSVGTSTAVNLREMEQMNDQLNALVHPNTQVSHHFEEGSMESKTCGHKEDFEQLQDKQEEVHQSRVYQEEETLVMNDSTPETTQPIPNTSAHPEPNLRDLPLHLVTTPEKNEESRADNLPVMVFDPSILSKNIQPVKKVKKKFEFEVITKERRISDENEQTAIAKKTLQKKKKKHNCWSSATLSHAELEAKKEDFTLHTVLDSDAKRKYFKLFAFREHNAENIMFYEHVQRYKRIYQKTVECTNSRQLSLLRTTLEHKARTIAHDYLFDTDSLNLLNTTSKLTAVVAQKISMDGFFATKEAGVLFDPIVFEIMGTIMPDMFIRFSISQEFKEMIESLNPKRKASSRSL
ncbi:hypothetical protein C9374_010174 [Naegleria lovaniensis]|uniref:RGS domain-containing protein n=1 Tax=Naegleria lovaniensis TaxID=51637 RepID=A0AA88KE04_NAELO|nr:uncharacterized protein C9374_010174 [Naegleria lovaniensis]KAG2375170.1 hypothetical protein C9374_010174 [Naegleria lovaniensis]